ncbi:hypothetical protein [Candidatus Nitrotoga sp. 1052]|uniref:hypothetical protein n=1 Tax=Candidatus Nitrotoga sp. 1052 TaxID=2886964 RepID=UPI001EF514B6|nr:hypothetical protein [Candidatus Nitrotoga sp. 1052]CAH1072489.1 hypothetical protein NTG1052_180076 [Candidatus Nitrotoga sp. 1052]
MRTVPNAEVEACWHHIRVGCAVKRLKDPSPAIVERAKIDVAAFHIIFNLYIE